MIPIVFYLLRERTRPSVEESMTICGYFLKQCGEFDREHLGACDIRVASFMRATESLDAVFFSFIMSEQGDAYLNKPKQYAWRFFSATTGEHAEETRVAIVFNLQGVTKAPDPLQPALQDFLDRGARWEALQLWGEAVVCYLIGLQLYPDDLDLKLCAGSAHLHRPRGAAAAYPLLLAVSDARAGSVDAAAAMADCYLQFAGNPAVTLKGASREQLAEWALVHYERACALDGGRADVHQKRDALRQRLNASPEECFFQK